VHVNVSVSRFLIPYCSRNAHSRDTDIDIHKKKDVRDSTIMNGQSRDTDIDIHKKKTLEMGKSGMDNLETLTLTYTR
jgi:hypothetical protein